MSLQIESPDHPIHSITVYNSSKAEIVRLFPIQLQDGLNKIEIKSLPATIDTKSIRVSGLGDARLHDVLCLLNERKRPGPTDSSEVLTQLRTSQGRLQRERESLVHEGKILTDYSRTLTGEHVSPSDLESFIKTFSQHSRQNLGAVADLDDKIEQMSKKIRATLDEISLRKGPKAVGEVSIVVAANSAANIDLKLTYIVSNASWQPTYELHATTTDGKPSSTVTLNYRAHVTQSTGEDWTDAQLTLSTSNTSMNTTIPELPTLKIKPKPKPPPMPVPMTRSAPPPPPARAMPMMAMSFGGPQSHSRHVVTNADEAPIESDEEDEDMGFCFMDDEVPAPTKTVVKDSALSVSYSVQGRATIPSDGIAHMVSLAELEFESNVKHIAVPRVESIVYLQCEVKNTSEYRLLPGSVGVILDDSFVSQTSILDVPAGDTFTCTLGVDPAIKITYSRKATHSDVKAGAFSEAKRTTTYTVRISVTNKHTFTLEDLVIREALPMVDVANPFSGDEMTSTSSSSSGSKARVLLRKPLGLAEGTPVDVFTLEGGKGEETGSGIKVRWSKVEGGSGDKDGKFEWFGQLAQGEKVELEAMWDIKAPEDVKWIEVNA
ncbi:hypothetical protein BDV98DRAFT_521053 [Pterulicium gracile]|uniref:Mucoidy inhibitor A n=1 Tax=Pterulicium gracile TaxID=1884261 RepID=A0A5C3R4R8_9AGAR|nr:hypothetical protein BDV98DRAFT_521053 [Pterula gracilis]